MSSVSETKRRSGWTTIIHWESVGCIHCHSGPNFSGADLYKGNIAMRIFPVISGSNYEYKYQLSDDLGFANNIAGAKRGIWRIPPLRNISPTAPYFHNGSVDNLEEVVRIMANLQLNTKLSNSSKDDSMIFWSKHSRQFIISNNHALNDDAIRDIVAFLESLNGEILK
ncbi:MAG: c-type cytochrome [Pseudomonadota bacterium]